MTFRMVRNIPWQRWADEPGPFFDVERADADGFPLEVLATGVSAEQAQAIIIRRQGNER